MEEKIQKVLDEKINPKLSEHFGQAVLTGVEDGVAYIKLTGACGGCPASEETFQYVVKQYIMEECPEVQDVVADTSVSSELLDFARKILNKEIETK